MMAGAALGAGHPGKRCAAAPLTPASPLPARMPASVVHARLGAALFVPFFALFFLLFAGAASAANSSRQAETRCGWFVNPTPGNISLLDRDGEWLIGMQGGHQAEFVDDAKSWPDFKPNRWVRTNGMHGYGCACLKVVTNRAAHEIDRVLSARTRPLAACRADHIIGKPD